MTRIGIAFNLKPEPLTTPVGATLASAGDETADPIQRDEEPPSNEAGRVRAARERSAVMSQPDGALLVEDVSADDEFAEWDTAETIDAVAAALAAYGTVIRLEATAEFPEQLRAERPDIVFNMAEGSGGKNREAHVPAICEFFGVPYTGSDPLTLSLCLDKSRTKEILSHYGVATPSFVVVESGDAVGAHWPALSLSTLREADPRRLVQGDYGAEPLPDAG